MDNSNMLRDAQGDFSGLRGLTVAQLRNIGEAALRSNHYTEAIRAFDQALTKVKTQNSKDSRLASLALLDLRVEARLRRNKYYRASKDAGTMIRLDRTDARGYFRLGQIKRMQGDRVAALNIYSTGLKYVLLNSPLRHILRTKHESTLQAMMLSKPTDPFTVLPPELLQMVLSYFNYSEATAIARRLEELARCHRQSAGYPDDFGLLGPSQANFEGSLQRLYPPTFKAAVYGDCREAF